MHIDRQHLVPVRRIGVGDRSDPHQAGVVDDDVESAQLGNHALHSRFGLIPVGDIGVKSRCGTAGRDDALLQLVEAVAAACDQRHGGSRIGQGDGGGLADSTARPGDQGDRAVQMSRHVIFVPFQSNSIHPSCGFPWTTT